MKVKKIGHCCMLIEIGEVKILTDPGNFSSGQDILNNIDFVLITHEHQDHIHIDSLKKIIDNNPNVKIYTNESVGKLLNEEGIEYNLILDKSEINLNGVLLEGFHCDHAKIHDIIPNVLVTAIYLDKIFYFPGDSFFVPNREVEILALPVEGPWMKVSEAVEFAKKINPKVCFPVHDARLREDRTGANYMVCKKYLNSIGIEFKILKEGEIIEFD